LRWLRTGPVLVVGDVANAFQVAATGRLAGCQISHVVCVASTKVCAFLALEPSRVLYNYSNH
jgi:hypothetical protein